MTMKEHVCMVHDIETGGQTSCATSWWSSENEMTSTAYESSRRYGRLEAFFMKSEGINS